MCTKFCLYVICLMGFAILRVKGETIWPPDPCSGAPCMNGGLCVIVGTEYICVCSPGWSGPRCSRFVDPCIPNPCMNDGRCHNPGQEKEVICKCRPTWIGRRCETKDVCSPNPCQNKGACEYLASDRSEFRCLCGWRYSGQTCSLNRLPDVCLSKPCKHRGRCIERDSKFKCLCKKGRTGKRCEKKIKKCADNPCQNNGKC
ncbi:unnamed protein product, partial [Owenia fusiformis]